MALRVVAYTSTVINGMVTLENSEEDILSTNNALELIEYLNEKYADPERTIPYYEIKVAWDLDQFIAPILKCLGVNACKQLAGTTHTFNFNGGSIFYIPGKIFSIDHSGHRSFIYHLAQYFEEEPEPEDAIGVQAMAQILMDELKKMGLTPLQLTSPVKIYENELLSHMRIPTILDLPNVKGENIDEVVEYAEQCVGKLWIEAYQVGHWNDDEIYSYDITSCFPYHATQLYNIKYAKYCKSHFFCDDADWAFLKGKVTINNDVAVSPIIHRGVDGSLTTPCGTWEDVITLDEYRFITTRDIGHFELDQGWFIKFTAPVKPFEIPLQRLFALRFRSPVANRLAKRMAAGVYGKCIERHDDNSVGKYYNPLMAAMISTRGRLQVAEFIYENKLQNDLVHVSVDGIISTKEVKLNGKKGMGEWKQNFSNPAIVISSGRIYTGDKHPQGLHYDDIISMIKANPNENYYASKKRRRQTLPECVELGDLKDLGRIKEFSSTLDLNLLRSGQDRVFPKYPYTGKDLLSNKYTSRPYEVGE
jgi:hypothetical protein